MKPLLFLIALFALTSCRKESKTPQFYIGETVYFNDINPSASFIPLEVYCPCKIKASYQEAAYYGWWYDLTDKNGNPVTHLYQSQLKTK